MNETASPKTPTPKKLLSKRSLVISTIFFVIIVLLAIVASSNHYRRKAALSLTKTAIAQYDKLLKSTAPLSFKKLLPVIHSIQQAKTALADDTTSYVITSTQNDSKLKAKINNIYAASNQKLFLPLLANRYEHAIAANLKNQQILYTFLTAYLMLSNPKDLNTKTLLTTILYTDPDINKAIFKQTLLDAIKPPFQGLPQQKALVAAARNSLESLPLEQQAMIVLLNQTLQPKIMLNHLDWFTPNALQIPTIYQKAAFQKTVNTNIPTATNAVLFGNLALGIRQNTRINPNDLSKLVYNLYLTDYANYWKNVLGWFHIKPLTHFNDIKQLITNFSQPSSELMQVLNVIHQNTNLAQINYLNKNLSELNNFYTNNIQTLAALQLRFKHENARLNNDTQTQLLQKIKQAISIQDYTLIPFKTALPPTVKDWLSEINTQYWKLSVGLVLKSINANWKTQIYAYYKQNFHEHFPFAPAEFPDTSLAKFTAFFKPNGLLDQFIKTNDLDSFFNLTKTTWAATPFPGFDAKNSTNIQTLQALHNISEMFFGKQATPNLNFSLTPLLLSDNIKQILLNVNGKLLIADQSNLNKSTAFTFQLKTNNKATLSLLDQNNQTLNIAKNGPWAWLRLLADNQVNTLGENDYMINFTLGKLHAQYNLKTENHLSPHPLSQLMQTLPPENLFH